jgi:hypothetical protein
MLHTNQPTAAPFSLPRSRRDGHEVPLPEAKLNSGDVVSIESRLVCQLYEVGGNVGCGLRRNLYSVVVLERR